jgi:hypothetical protein
MPELVCKHCRGNLSIPGSITYMERYPGYLETLQGSSLVVADALLIDSAASCAGCGADVEFTHADITSGGFLRASSTT